jgi:hypothetical protein
VRISRLKRGILTTVVIAGLVAAAAGDGAPAAPGNASAKAQVAAAFQRLNGRPRYRMRRTGREGIGVGEVIQPDKLHTTVRTSQGTFEFIAVGTESRLRLTKAGHPAGWQCNPGGRRPAFLSIVDRMRHNETPMFRKPDTEIEGTPVHVYADTSGNTLYVDSLTGLPRRIVDTGKQSAGTLDFYYYGTPFTIALPPCR